MEEKSPVSGNEGEFRPELLSRRGEIIAWISTLMVTVVWIGLRVAGLKIPFFLVFLGVFLFFAAVFISLSNFIDRRTVLRLGESGIEFENGLRHVRLEWSEIMQVQVLPTMLGRKVRVIGADRVFQFYTLSEVKLGGEVKGRTGFLAGEHLLKYIIETAGLREIRQDGGARYYARN
jgi:hypothetical protein